MVRGYPGRASVFSGETLSLHAASDSEAEPFRVFFFRWDGDWELYGKSDLWTAPLLPAGGSTQAWGWPANPFPIPLDWPSGPYLALFAGAGEDSADLRRDGGRDLVKDALLRKQSAFFVVKRSPLREPAQILYKFPLFTYCAYNNEGGGSLYTGPRERVTLHRPGGGAGGDPCDIGVPDAYDLSSPRQTFAHWDAPFVRWLESNGYAVDYCTDLDLHDGSCRLESYRLLLSVGHDEYWSRDMRSRLENFIASGGNAAFFSGNTCWWRLHVTDEGTALACNKHRLPGDTEAFDQWMRIDPETRLTGVSFRYGGGWWSGRRDALGYEVRKADHWIYAGTGLRNGDTFGGGPEQGLIGYECDGASFADGTPESFQILGTRRLTSNWEYAEHAEGAAATMGIYQNVGTVFTAATTDWARVLMSDPLVDRITRNVIDGLTAPAKD
ncbi:MAG TPA: N,N-dimethylformamidase beta subunit family domain-containing protein [Bryobacteraceae bacterium]|jgi:hypothetical protein